MTNPYDAPASAHSEMASTVSAPIRTGPLAWLFRIFLFIIAGGLASQITFDLSVFYAVLFREFLAGVWYAVGTALWVFLWAAFAFIWIKWPWTSGMILCYVVAILVTPADPISLFVAAVVLWTLYLIGGACWKLRHRPRTANNG